jgi:hypothetical protein
MAVIETVQTVSQVLDELKTQAPEVYEVFKAHHKSFQIANDRQFAVGVSQVVEILGNDASYLWEQTGGKNPDPADPWIISVAKVYGYTVVTNERRRSEKRIPAACRLPKIGVRCISGPHFLLETGIVKDVKYETVDPASFFANDQG